MMQHEDKLLAASTSPHEADAHNQKLSKLDYGLLFGPGLHSVRPVTRNEFVKEMLAMDACWKEWGDLESKRAWQWATLAEWSDVSREARRRGARST